MSLSPTALLLCHCRGADPGSHVAVESNAARCQVKLESAYPLPINEAQPDGHETVNNTSLSEVMLLLPLAFESFLTSLTHASRPLDVSLGHKAVQKSEAEFRVGSMFDIQPVERSVKRFKYGRRGVSGGVSIMYNE